MVLWVYFKLFENVPPDCFHFIPVFDDTMLDWVVQLHKTFEFFLQDGVFRGLMENLQQLCQ